MKRLLSEAERRAMRSRLWREVNTMKHLPRRARLTFFEGLWLHWLEEFYAGGLGEADGQATTVAEGPPREIEK